MIGRKIAVFFSIIALVFASLNVLYSSSNGLPMQGPGMLFLGVIVVLYFNYTSYKSQGKK